MLTLSRLAQDLILFSMPEFAYFRLPAEFTTGSSIMPQKRNPDVLELVRAKAAKVLAQAGLAAEILRAAPGHNRDLQEIKEPFLDGFEVTISSLRILTALVKGLEADPEALRRGFVRRYLPPTALELVATGIPFRDAYHQVKAQLDRLVDKSPDQALAAKRHLGAPMGLDWAALAARVRQAATWAQRVCARHRACQPPVESEPA